MDPITATVIAGVLWFFLGSIGSVVLYLVIGGIFVAVSAVTGKEYIAPIGIFLAWLAVIVWEIFVIIQVVLHAVQLIELVVGSA